MLVKTVSTVINSSANVLRVMNLGHRPALRVSRKPIMWLLALQILTVTSAWGSDLPDFSALIEQEGDAVVKISIVTERPTTGIQGIPGLNLDNIPPGLLPFLEQLPQNPSNRGTGFGSGFIISEDGYVITNAHVVDNATAITVGLQDQREYSATLIGSDVTTDIALLKLDATGLPTVRFGDSDVLKTGQWVLAIGSPYGFEHTATQGIVSALARSLPEDTYVPFIQTDVAVNPGNSGGPLFNTDGEVVGVNSQIFSRSGGYQGLSFAIPINVAMSVADQLKANGYATRGWLGVQIQTLTQDLASAYNLDRPRGAFVASVIDGSPAQKAGIQVEDIILTFNNKGVRHADALPPLVGSVVPGSTVEMVVLRNGKEQSLPVTIDALQQDKDVASAHGSMDKPVDADRLGVVVSDADEQQLAELKVEFGVVVSEVMPGSPAAEAGVQAGDVIASLAREPIDSVEKLSSVIADVDAGQATPMRVYRDGTALFVAITLNS